MLRGRKIYKDAKERAEQEAKKQQIGSEDKNTQLLQQSIEAEYGKK